MVEANVKTIEELKSFLDTVAADAEIRRLVTQADSDLSRNRKLPLQRLVALIINLPKGSLRIELQEFFAALGNEQGAATKGALSLQRTQLQALFFQLWNQWLVDLFYHFLPLLWSQGKALAGLSPAGRGRLHSLFVQ